MNTLEDLKRDKEELRKNIHNLLTDFENKYGVIPSITITKSVSTSLYKAEQLEEVVVRVTL
jgi:hypothetical protein